MRKIMNQAETMVDEMLQGMLMAHSELELLPQYRVVKKKEIDRQKVSLISGGGSGHEPAHVGYIGQGMLDAAVCGDVFASPSQIQIYQAIKATASEKGCLLIVKNYSGDVMNFQNAARLAAEDGISVESVKVDDDIAVQDSLYTVGRRGVAGTVLVHKVAGAAAQQGLRLHQVKAAAEMAIKNTRSLGFALGSCTVPAKGTATFSLDETEMEYGVGIHGEPGIVRTGQLSAAALAERMLSALIEELALVEGDEITLLVNGFGSTPLMELYLFNRNLGAVLERRGIKLFQNPVGNYMTSIDMLGASVTIMKMNDALRGWLTAASTAPAFIVQGSCVEKQSASINKRSSDHSESSEVTAHSAAKHLRKTALVGDKVFLGDTLSTENLVALIEQMSACIIRNEVAFCELDSFAGDGDFGMSVAKGFRQLQSEWPDILAESADAGMLLEACSMIIMEHCGGASGPIWGAAFRAAGKSAGGKQTLNCTDIAELLQAAVRSIQAVGERAFGRGAVVGDKTLMDALIPCADTWSLCAASGCDLKEAFQRGAAAAVQGAKASADIVARMGRAGAVGERSLGYPDAGAHALGIIFSELAQTFAK